MSTILVVDDEPFNQEIIEEYLSGEGYELVTANDGLSAWSLLQQTPDRFDLILLDRMMPCMDGLEVLHRINRDQRLKFIPVIMQTAAASTDQIEEGIRLGAFYYLAKPYGGKLLRTLVRAALHHRHDQLEMFNEVHRHDDFLSLLQQAQFIYRNLHEGLCLANYLARMCPDPSLVMMGLSELLINAVEHGNLGISCEEKAQLLERGEWMSEIQRRLENPGYKQRYVNVFMERADDCIRFTITDQGMGFNWQNYIDFDPLRAFALNGRGIATAKQLVFNNLEYQGRGNRVIATVSLKPTTRPDENPLQ